MFCEFFKRYGDEEELLLGIELWDEIELFMHE
jgi:hypothetical protein